MSKAPEPVLSELPNHFNHNSKTKKFHQLFPALFSALYLDRFVVPDNWPSCNSEFAFIMLIISECLDSGDYHRYNEDTRHTSLCRESTDSQCRKCEVN